MNLPMCKRTQKVIHAVTAKHNGNGLELWKWREKMYDAFKWALLCVHLRLLCNSIFAIKIHEMDVFELPKSRC